MAKTVYIIEIPKFKKYKDKSHNSNLNKWIKFIESPEVADMNEKGIKEAKEVLEEISNDERERWLAELREKYIMDQKAIEDAGFDKGEKNGIQKGIKKGIAIRRKRRTKENSHKIERKRNEYKFYC